MAGYGDPPKDKRFKPGKSGNPKGRPKKLPGLDQLLIEVLADEKDGRTAAQAILISMRSKAIKGDVRAAEVLLDRAYGKIRQEIDLNTEKPMKITRRIVK